MRLNNKGFSLIELLVAISIVVMAISLANIIYSNYVSADQKFAKKAMYYSELLQVADFVRNQVKESRFNGEFTQTPLECEWAVTDTISSKKTEFDFESGGRSQSSELYNLHTVQIQCEINTYVLPIVTIKVLNISESSISDEVV